MSTDLKLGAAHLRPRRSHIWEREVGEHYVEPPWCSERLFEVEIFRGPVHDPCCGFGTIPEAALRAGFAATGSDIVDRGWVLGQVEDFLRTDCKRWNIVCNPPFNIAQEFTEHALRVAGRKVAIIFPVARLNAARWLANLPLRRIWLLTPRPSMPPGHVIAAGDKPGGGKMDFCWLVLEQRYKGAPEMGWLHRDKNS
jgi:hypothetical protein